ncbi:ankyrin repeat-containing protein BDA1-like isoform X2 [Rhododendron vialii]|uniref:ankyrin repeat-containing protein BDA1-like isoform X2 n=1 Tax=Rhododendron vialii TaxID=182163 RepID=UPI00265E3508|nr:ankyrin repeat-containing protein BDA1-like isoform X2 [Rhododendron vialii]
MEHGLCVAATTGNIDSLPEIIGKDELILDRVAAGCSSCTSPLHVATSNNRLKFVEELLRRKPELAEVLDSQLRSALHLASAKGHYEIVKALVKANPEMCLVRDREGKNPLHLAAVKGNFNELKELVRACPQAARERVDRNETILHLCVKHNQWKSLEILLETIQGEELVNAKDNDENTVLHLAVLDQRLEIASHVLKNQTVDVNVENASGHTAMDILIRVQMSIARSDKKESCLKEDTQDLDSIKDLLRGANAKRAKDLVGGHWLKKKKNSLMVVASLIATMAFQAGVNPPGGVWQDNSHGHRAGEAVMAYNYQDSYPFFLRFNTIGFVASLSTILLLISGLKFKNKASMWILIVSMWLAITSMAITYAFSNVVITPKEGRRPLTNTIVIAVIVWSSVMTLLLLKHTYHLVAIFVEEERNKKKNATERIMEFKSIMEQSLSNGWSILRKCLGLGDGGAKPPLPVTTEMY